MIHSSYGHIYYWGYIARKPENNDENEGLDELKKSVEIEFDSSVIAYQESPVTSQR